MWGEGGRGAAVGGRGGGVEGEIAEAGGGLVRGFFFFLNGGRGGYTCGRIRCGRRV